MTDEGRRCVRCQGPMLDTWRRKFCSDACADSASRERLKLRKVADGILPGHGFAKRTYRVYDYRGGAS